MTHACPLQGHRPENRQARAPRVRAERHPALLGHEDVQEMLKHAWGDLANVYITLKCKRKKPKRCFYYKKHMNSYSRGKGTPWNTKRQEDCPKPHQHLLCARVCPGTWFSTSHSLQSKPCGHDISDSMCAGLHDFRRLVSRFTCEQNRSAVMTPIMGRMRVW